MKLEMKLPCPKSEAIESYEILLAVCRAEDAYLAVGYKQMRDLLERICRAQMQNESLQMTDLSARISFVAAKVGLSVAEQNRLHTFRLTSNAILNRQQEPNREQLLRDAKTLAFFIRKLLEEDIPHGTIPATSACGCYLPGCVSCPRTSAANACLLPVCRRAIFVCDSLGRSLGETIFSSL